MQQEYNVKYLIGLGVWFISPILAIVFGAWFGVLGEIFLGDTIRAVLATINNDLSNIELWKLGAVLGFFSCFFSSKITMKD